MSGNNDSHAHNKTRRKFNPNVHKKSFVLGDGRKVTLKVSAHGMRIIDRRGIDRVWAEIQSR